MNAILPARSPRVDGWTVDIQRTFIHSLSEFGCVRRACQEIGRSPTGAYALRARDAAFREAWNAALGMAYYDLCAVSSTVSMMPMTG